MSLVSGDGTKVNRRAFFDEDIYALECERIFKRAWQFLAHESEVAAPGEYVTRTLGGDAVIVTRDEDGRVNVLHNSCRHRGVQLCAADLGNTSHFRCSYHGWTYNNAGDLRGVPHAPELYGKRLDRATLGLKRARTESFCGLIFGTWQHDGPSLRETLGDMAWYMETVFGRCEMEVMGPPIRSDGAFNWKSGVENWSNDAYHADVTHKSVLEAGVGLDMPPVIAHTVAQGAGQPIPDPTLEKVSVCQYVVEGGHAGGVYRLPVNFEQRRPFLGYEPELWDEFASNLTPEQVDVATRRFACIGTVFPNFSFVEQVFGHLGDDTPPMPGVNIRVWLPLGANRTELRSWVLVPKKASPQWKRNSQRAFLRTLGVGGMFETDDFQNWASMAKVGTGPISFDTDNDYTGLPDEQPTTELPWPGKVYPGMLHDVMWRELYLEWQRWMDTDAAATPTGATVPAAAQSAQS